MDRDSISCKYPGQNTSYCLNQRIKDAAALGATVFVDIHFNTGGGGNGSRGLLSKQKAIMKESIRKVRNLANKILSELISTWIKKSWCKRLKDGTTGETGSEWK